MTDTDTDTDAGPLSGIVVIDLSRALAGPIAAMNLGDLGARVIKVETPGVGDDARTWGPPFIGEGAEQVSTYFLSANRNKESITLDLKSPEGLETFVRLLRRADVLIENFRPGVMDRLGLSNEALAELNPALVVLSITGFGHDGPEGGRAGYDQIAQGEAGLMSLTGPDPEHPTRIGVPIADVLAGMHGTYGVCAALVGRQRTGRGAVVRTSLLAAAMSAHTFQGTLWTVAHQVARAQGNHHPQIAPYGSFRCADGSVQVAVGSDALWRSFAPVAGLDPDDPRFSDASRRLSRREELVEEIENSFQHRDRDSLLVELAAAGVPSGAIRSLDEVYTWDQTRSQGLVIEVDHAAGPIELPGPAVRMETLDGHELGRTRHDAPPVLGEDQESVLAWLDGPAD